MPVAVADLILDVVVRVAAGCPDRQTAAAIVETQSSAVDVLVAAETERVAAAFAPLTIAAAPDAEAAASIRRPVHLQCDVTGEQFPLVVERIRVSAVRLRARLVEEGFGLSHRHVVNCRDQRRRIAGGTRDQTLEARSDSNLVRSGRGADA